jgi:hypothetical protein
MDDLIAFFSEMECYPDPIMQERIKMAISALEALQAERDDYAQLSRAASGEADVLRARIAQLLDLIEEARSDIAVLIERHEKITLTKSKAVHNARTTLAVIDAALAQHGRTSGDG